MPLSIVSHEKCFLLLINALIHYDLSQTNSGIGHYKCDHSTILFVWKQQKRRIKIYLFASSFMSTPLTETITSMATLQTNRIHQHKLTCIWWDIEFIYYKLLPTNATNYHFWEVLLKTSLCLGSNLARLENCLGEFVSSKRRNQISLGVE